MSFKFRSTESIELQKYESENGYNFRRCIHSGRYTFQRSFPFVIQLEFMLLVYQVLAPSYRRQKYSSSAFESSESHPFPAEVGARDSVPGGNRHHLANLRVSKVCFLFIPHFLFIISLRGLARNVYTYLLSFIRTFFFLIVKIRLAKVSL